MSYPVPQSNRGAGWLLFASVVMISAGVMRLLDAFWAFDKDDELTGPLQVLIYDDNLSAYGWIWLITGALLVIAGVAVMAGSELARWFGIFMASIAAISSMLWVYEFPIWSLLYTGIAVAVIYALALYGGRYVD